ncbi:MAG: 2-C-methyl-D-erythritol 2,4-cyclodiphosphate synthase [Cycloclasticus sp. symbiont of Poecilosclerida sp. M]|nr:MAG: 2-C-methyl-D-erythritol 2,4-cyclodiphosphate synthase [Cycloclasticus sp. symbiont of Poecilosclerida sp. M]
MRIGHGYDAHQFVKGKPLVLAGVNIPYEFGLLAYSDGDVALHALCDGLLGAAALGDIGKHFPDTDASYKNIDSRLLLKQVIEKLSTNGYALVNADITIIAEAPKLAPYITQMTKNIACDCRCDNSQVNVKATTTEGMGFTGRKEGIEVHAVVLLKQET